MDPLQRKTTKRVRSKVIRNMPFVEIREEDITDTMEVESSASDLISSLEQIKNLWELGKVDYVAPIMNEDQKGYLIYTPEKGAGGDDWTVPKQIDSVKGYGRGREIKGVYIDTVKCQEDSYNILIAKVVLRKS